MDHDRVNIHTSQMSCGVAELSRIGSDVKDVLYAIGSRLYHPSRGEPVAFFAFSDVVGEQDTSSSILVDTILNWKLGSIVCSDRAENPRTGNIIVVYIWAIDHEKFKAWYAERRVAKLAKVGR
jgi:hypothetical protein